MKKWIISFLLLTCLLAGCGSVSKTVDKEGGKATPEMHVSAAASLMDALEEIKPMYEAEHHVELVFNFGGSGKIAQQIMHEAPADVFISANENWMDILVDEGFVHEKTRTTLTGNKLVLVAKASNEQDEMDVSDLHMDAGEQIAVGNPESVPAGEYTQEVLTNLGKWGDLEDRFVYAKDVRQVLTYVSSGNADIGFVYQSDALTTDDVKTVAEIDSNLHAPIVYSSAVVEYSELQDEAREFMTFLEGEEAQEILTSYGFVKE